EITIKTKRIVIYENIISSNGELLISIPSAYNKLFEIWRNKSITITKNYATTFVTFLNFTSDKVSKEDDYEYTKLKEQGIYGLNFYHIQQFLIYCIEVKKLNYKTIKQYENRLLQIYDFLIQLELLNEDVVIEKEAYEVKGKKYKEVRRINPFKAYPYIVPYPKKVNVKSKKLINMESEYWQLFLRIAEKKAPNIVFGIALQMFGGLRQGEVVNLITNDVEEKRAVYKDTSILNLNIEYRADELFKEMKVDLTFCQVKKARKQMVFNFNTKLYEYYEIHLEERATILKKNKKTTPALFVDKNGNPMSGKEFSKQWTKIKRIYLNILKEKVYKEYLRQLEMKWGSHIGRGIFTNLCLTYQLAKTPHELKNLRGDSNENSSKAYIDEFLKIGLIYKVFNQIGKDVILINEKMEKFNYNE
ncbi:MAG: hypothetical protein ACRC28_17025, partial [Clostridium sp.]|uniref:hypothetical protein n=1 Tax=Clostridium sp. TaxID=1506 RepID=UPI003F3E0227